MLPLMYLSLCELVVLALQVCVGLTLQLHLMLKVSLHENRSLSRLHEALGPTLRAHHAAYGVITSSLRVMHADLGFLFFCSAFSRHAGVRQELCIVLQLPHQQHTNTSLNSLDLMQCRLICNRNNA